MKIEKPNHPDEIEIFVEGVNPNTILKDYRIVQRYGNIFFGSISQVARNLGISMKKVENGLIFYAPRSRIQMFVEKLHFSLIQYKQI